MNYRLRIKLRAALRVLVGSLSLACGSSSPQSKTGATLPDASVDADISALLPADASADAGNSCKPTILTGPITGANKPFAYALLDLAAIGYVEEEYFVEGDATAYDWKTAPGIDGPWDITPTTTAHYKTRFLVRRPTDPMKFNGSVFVEWLNVSGGIDDDPDFTYAHVELLRSGWAYVGVSAQQVGVMGGGFALIQGTKPLVQWDPERYKTLSHPGDNYSYDMFSQVACLLHQAPSGAMSGDRVKPLGALTPARFIAAGESQSAGRMATYTNAIQPVDKVFDGIFIHSRGGGGAPLSAPAGASPLAMGGGPSIVHIRGDLTVPVLQFLTETDVGGATGMAGFYGARQADTDRLRSWEVAGTSHADQYILDYNKDNPSNGVVDGGLTGSCMNINTGPHHWVDGTAVAALHAWVKDGTLPAHGDPLIVSSDGGSGFAKDAIGNSLGGIRTAAVDVPIAVYSGQGSCSGGPSCLICGIFGSTLPLPAAQLMLLYPMHTDYVSKVTAATNMAQQKGFILAADVPLIVKEADAARVPQ